MRFVPIQPVCLRSRWIFCMKQLRTLKSFQNYQSHADLIWPDGTFNIFCSRIFRLICIVGLPVFPHKLKILKRWSNLFFFLVYVCLCTSLQDCLRWVVMFGVGFLTALVACSIDIAIELLANIKFSLLSHWTDKCVEGSTHLSQNFRNFKILLSNVGTLVPVPYRTVPRDNVRVRVPRYQLCESRDVCVADPGSGAFCFCTPGSGIRNG